MSLVRLDESGQELTPAFLRRRGLRRGRGRVAYRHAGPGRAAYALATMDRKVARRVLANPLWIALTAPARWLLERLRPVGFQTNGLGVVNEGILGLALHGKRQPEVVVGLGIGAKLEKSLEMSHSLVEPALLYAKQPQVFVGLGSVFF